jgi:hypothetical protein
MLFRQSQACSAGPGARTNGENRFDPTGAGTLQHRRQIGGKSVIVQVCVRID